MNNTEVSELCRKKINDLVISYDSNYKKLSAEIGKSETYIQKIMDGKSKPPIYTINDICNCYDITLSSFFDEGIKHTVEYERNCKLMKEAPVEILDAIYVLLNNSLKYKK
ncbi:MAG: hypothetical protein ACI4D8_05850 [Wujia sp.]